MNTKSEIHAVCRNGRRIYVLPEDERGKRLREFQGNVNPNSLRAWQVLASEGWTHIIDVGANYGEMLVNLDVPDGAALFAVEPNPLLTPILTRTMKEAALPVQIVSAALSATEGSAMLSADLTWSGLSRLGIEAHPEGQDHRLQQFEVRTTTLAAILDDRQPATAKRLLLKIDVEGAECDVLRGLGDMLDQLEDFACLVEVLHLPLSDIDWLIAHFQPEVFDPMTGQLIPIHGGSERLRRVLGLGAFHFQDIVVRRRRK
ncbi:FkbM family methyltransferase [Variovorax sp. LARHSF232]